MPKKTAKRSANRSSRSGSTARPALSAGGTGRLLVPVRLHAGGTLARGLLVEVLSVTEGHVTICIPCSEPPEHVAVPRSAIRLHVA